MIKGSWNVYHIKGSFYICHLISGSIFQLANPGSRISLQQRRPQPDGIRQLCDQWLAPSAPATGAVRGAPVILPTSCVYPAYIYIYIYIIERERDRYSQIERYIDRLDKIVSDQIRLDQIRLDQIDRYSRYTFVCSIRKIFTLYIYLHIHDMTMTHIYIYNMYI